MKTNALRTVTVTALVSIAATVVALRWDLVPGYRRTTQREISPVVAAAPGEQPALSADEETNIRVYSKVGPGVVNITATVVEYDFFFNAVPNPGTGSGIVLDLDGNILTNNHVVAEASNLEVTLPDQTSYHARLVGADKQTDLAIIRMEKAPRERLHPVVLGNSNGLRVGQKVLAIGNPLRLQNTLTVGIISSLGRKIRTESGDLVENVIQTDAAINPGNSGGPLLNTAGDMIGINTSIFTIGGGNIGIGFAIPINTVRRIAAELMQSGRVIRAWLGVDGYELNDELARALDLGVGSGILVARVYRGSSAEKAGIHGADQVALLYNERFFVGGDVITHVDGKPVTSREELRLAMEDKKPGSVVTLTLYRGRSKLEKKVEMLEAPRQRGLRF
jgi:S1-C subfamily serine protease